MRRIAVALVVLLALTGCAAPSTAPPSTTSTSVPTADNAETCIYLAGGAFDSAVDFFLTYTTDRDNADPRDLDSVIDKFDIARGSASDKLADALDDMLVELSAIEERFSTGDAVEPAVDYQALADSLDEGMAVCQESLQSD